MAEREFWSVSRMFVGLLERSEVDALRDHISHLHDVRSVPDGNRTCGLRVASAFLVGEGLERSLGLLAGLVEALGP
jgi:hypothetical protein